MITIALFGCGAIGSQLAMHIASEDIMFRLVDDDRIEEDNIATSAFMRHQVGAHKAVVLSSLLWAKTRCRCMSDTDTIGNQADYRRIVKDCALALDCFDNVEARGLTCLHLVPTLHVGVSREGTGSVTWDTHYQQFDGAPRGQDGFCTHLAGRDILRLTACVAAHIVEQYLETGVKESLTITKRLTILR